MFDLPLWLWLQSLVQGITEFLPVSSTGHLGLGWGLMEHFGLTEMTRENQQLIDIALHVGTLLAVMVYFIRDLWQVLAGGLALFTPASSRQDPRSHLFITLLIASVPIFLMGILFAEARDEIKNNLALIAATSILFGILLWVADRFFWSTNKLRDLGYGAAVFLGLMQCLALIPGVSRSGITMTAGRFLGLERVEATRFSMLLAVPAIFSAGTYGAIQLARQADVTLNMQAFLAALLAFLAALAAIHVLMELSRRTSYLPFVIYRLALGLAIYAYLIFYTPLPTPV